jgi:hypothetical protein
MLGGAIALLAVAAANAEAPNAPAPGTAASTARVESAGADGGLPTRIADVQSAQYDAAQRPAERMPSAAMRLPLLVAIGAGALAIGLFFSLRRRQRAPRV